METKQIRERLRGSLEMHVLVRNAVLVVVVTTLLTAFYSLINGGVREHFWIFAAMMYGLMVLPVLIFYGIRAVRIFARPEAYMFCRTTLANPRGGMLRDRIYFTVMLEDPRDGSRFFADTHAIFNARGGHPSLEEYTNSTVTIAWNRETDMVVVIG